MFKMTLALPGSESVARAADHLLSVARAHSLSFDQLLKVLERRAHGVQFLEDKNDV